MSLIDCPFCWTAVNEEVMSKHIDWHFPGDEEEVKTDRYTSDIPQGIEIDL